MTLGEAGGTIAPQYEFRLPNGLGGTECPLDGTRYEVWKLPGRRLMTMLVFLEDGPSFGPRCEWRSDELRGDRRKHPSGDAGGIHS